jgi:lipopolysaccharide/colanic/teichoic acid biosynthesis glycosyltransferase
MATAECRPGQDTPRDAADQPRALPLLSEPLFRQTLVRERRRAERSDRAVGLLLLNLEHRDRGDADVWRALLAAIATASRDTDVVGWFKKRQTLGIILPADARQHHTRNTDLFRALEAQSVRGFSIQLCLLHTASGTPNPGPHASDPLLAPMLYESRPRRYDVVKRLLDLTLSVILLVVLAPVMAVVAALVKLTSRGPVLFKQQRVGHLMQPFVMLKFRTMEVNAPPAIHQEFISAFITGSGSADQADSKRVFKIVKDPRVTSIGHFLRRSSLDELPQLWNVVRGDMSLVGPRPPLPYEVAQYKPWHLHRIAGAKPGVTGLWQVTGRSRTTFDEMVRLDLRYVRGRSLWTDLRILLATPRAVISGKGAC